MLAYALLYRSSSHHPLLDIPGVHLVPAGLSGLAGQVAGANQRTADV